MYAYICILDITNWLYASYGLRQTHMLPQVGTFNGHPIAAVAGLVHMREIDAIGYDGVNAIGQTPIPRAGQRTQIAQ